MAKNKEENQKLFLLAIGFVFIYVIFNNVIMNNLHKRVKMNDTKIKKAQTQYLQGIQDINSLEKAYREYYYKVYTRDYMSSKLIAKGEERYLGETITNLSIEHNLKLSNINFSDKVEADTQKYILTTDFTTDFYTLKDFLNSIDDLEKNINLDDMVIRKGAGKLDISASFSIYMSE